MTSDYIVIIILIINLVFTVCVAVIKLMSHKSLSLSLDRNHTMIAKRMKYYEELKTEKE